jgi:thiol-disulfide isomerase/thioredoxin
VNAISIGPLVLASDRAAAIAGLFAFMFVAGMIARRVDERVSRWSLWALLGGILGARVAHVFIHRDSFGEEPLRALALWQGGFFWPAGLVIALGSIVFLLDSKRARLASLVPVLAGLFVWNAADRLTAGVEAIPLPETSFQTLAGQSVQLAAHSERPMVLNLWASWCPPCRREMPMMVDVAASSPGVSFVFANQGEHIGQITSYLRGERLTLPLALLDRLGELGRHYKAPGLPATLFIDAEGRLVDIHLGEISREVFVEKIGQLKSGR